MSPLTVFKKMHMAQGEVGEYKLAWTDEDNKKILYSKMFDTLEGALSESVNHNDYFIFKLKTNENGNYSWDLLPYGMSRWYQFGLTVQDYMPAIIITTGAIIALSVLLGSLRNSEVSKGSII